VALLQRLAMAGYLIQRHTGLPKVVGYRWWARPPGWPASAARPGRCRASGLFLLELGMAVVLFECGGRISLRWFRHNPMVLVQSIAESVLTYFAVYWVLFWLDVPTQVAGPLALVALAASPAVLTRVVADTRAAGPVTERAMVLATLSTLYALTLGSAWSEQMNRPKRHLAGHDVRPVWWCWACPLVVAAVLALVLRTGTALHEPDQRKHLDAAAHADRRGLRRGLAHGRLGAAGGAAGRHPAQAAQPAALGLAAPAGQRPHRC
jgi:hypothetical protein